MNSTSSNEELNYRKNGISTTFIKTSKFVFRFLKINFFPEYFLKNLTFFSNFENLLFLYFEN